MSVSIWTASIWDKLGDGPCRAFCEDCDWTLAVPDVDEMVPAAEEHAVMTAHTVKIEAGSPA